MANMRYAMHATRGRTLPCINCSENTPQCWIELFSCQGMNWYNTHCKALHRMGVNLWVQTTVGGWVWLKSHLDLVGGTEKIAMAHGVIREVKDSVWARWCFSTWEWNGNDFKVILFWSTHESKVVLINHPIKSEQHVLRKHRKNCECCPVSQLIVR